MYTLANFNRDVLTPMIKREEERRGMTAVEIVRQCEAELEPHRRVMRDVRTVCLGDDDAVA